MTTRALAEYLGKIKKGGDNLSGNIVADSLDQIQKSTKTALGILKSLACYHKENYKFEVRLSVLPKMDLDGVKALNQREDVLKQMKKRFVMDLPGKAFYPELLTEILDEDYSAEADNQKEAVLSRLKIKEAKGKTQTAQVSFAVMLLETIRLMAAVSRYLDEAVMKIVDNSFLLENKKLPFFERFKRWIIKLSQKDEAALAYEVEYFDITTSSTKHETIPIQDFRRRHKEKGEDLQRNHAKSGTVYKKIEQASEDQLFTFLNKNLEELGIILRRFQASTRFLRPKFPGRQEQPSGHQERDDGNKNQPGENEPEEARIRRQERRKRAAKKTRRQFERDLSRLRFRPDRSQGPVARLLTGL